MLGNCVACLYPYKSFYHQKSTIQHPETGNYCITKIDVDDTNKSAGKYGFIPEQNWKLLNSTIRGNMKIEIKQTQETKLIVSIQQDEEGIQLVGNLSPDDAEYLICSVFEDGRVVCSSNGIRNLGLSLVQ